MLNLIQGPLLYMYILPQAKKSNYNNSAHDALSAIER